MHLELFSSVLINRPRSAGLVEDFIFPLDGLKVGPSFCQFISGNFLFPAVQANIIYSIDGPVHQHIRGCPLMTSCAEGEEGGGHSEAIKGVS